MMEKILQLDLEEAAADGSEHSDLSRHLSREKFKK